MATPAPSVDYRALFRSLPASYLLLDAGGTIVDNTDRHEAVSLKPRAEIVGRHVFEAFPPTSPNDYDTFRASLDAVRTTRRPDTMPLIRYDLERPASEGGGFAERYWEASHHPLLDERGELQYILQLTEDVTARHLAERQHAATAQALAETQSRFEFILEALPVMVWTLGSPGHTPYFNRRLADFIGQPVEALPTWDWRQTIHPDDQAMVYEGWTQARGQATERQFEYRLRRHDGEYRWVLARGVPQLDAQGRPQMVVCCATDIHDQRRMVEELLHANEQQAHLSDQAYQAFQLAESRRETFYQLFLDAPVLVAITRGPDHIYEFANPLYRQLFPDREIIGRSLAEAIPEANVPEFLAALRHVLDTGQPLTGTEAPLRVQRRDTGTVEEVYLNFTYQAFREAGQTVGLAVFAFDVTDLVRARQALEGLRGSPPDASV